MSRPSGRGRTAARLTVPLVAAILAVWLGLAAPLATAHAAPGAVPAGATIAAAGTGTAPPPTDDGPVTTANPFLPDQQDLTDCVGLVERPGCGSEARGGLHQNLVAIAMVLGLLVVFGRVAWVIRRSQQRAARSADHR